jgi:hypothetical protein
VHRLVLGITVQVCEWIGPIDSFIDIQFQVMVRPPRGTKRVGASGSRTEGLVRAVRSTANRCGEGQSGLEGPTGPPPMKLARPREIAHPFLTRPAGKRGNYRRSRDSKRLTAWREGAKATSVSPPIIRRAQHDDREKHEPERCVLRDVPLGRPERPATPPAPALDEHHQGGDYRKLDDRLDRVAVYQCCE